MDNKDIDMIQQMENKYDAFMPVCKWSFQRFQHYYLRDFRQLLNIVYGKDDAIWLKKLLNNQSTS